MNNVRTRVGNSLQYFMSLTQHRLDIIDGQKPVKRDRFYNIEITDLEKRVSDLLQYCDSHRFSCLAWFILRVKHHPFEIEKSLVHLFAIVLSLLHTREINLTRI